MIPDIKSAALLFTFFSVMLKNASSESEAETLYSLLKDGIKFMPSAFPTTYSILVERLGNVLEMGQNQEIFENVISILDNMFCKNMDKIFKSEKKERFVLSQVGFGGLTNIQFFSPNKTVQRPIKNVSQTNIPVPNKNVPTKTPIKSAPVKTTPRTTPSSSSSNTNLNSSSNLGGNNVLQNSRISDLLTSMIKK